MPLKHINLGSTFRRLAPLVAFFVLAGPAAAAGTSAAPLLDPGVARARGVEATLETQIGSLTSQIHELGARVSKVSTQLGSLEHDLEIRNSRLAHVTALLARQASQLASLDRQRGVATARLGRQLVQIHESARAAPGKAVLDAGSVKDARGRTSDMKVVAERDARIVAAVALGHRRASAARARTERLRVGAAASTRVVALRVAQSRTRRAQLLSRQRSLAGARGDRQRALASVSVQIRAHASSRSSSRSSSPLVRPASGPITSPYGVRWGRLHAGIDIGAAIGTPIHAAATGRVIFAGYSGDYGNLIVIDHGDGLTTAYAHQSRLVAAVGREVAQGEVIGYVGSTGSSTGAHLHFEVRVHGSAVDPMSYF
jgi:murein DD-endopeptidase MepM/ murein hydrolase activator NlpD